MASKAPMQERGQYGIATAASKLDCVQIDGLVVLKIIKHSRDEGNPNEMVSGQLLGMDITQNDTTTLEVTSCFPMPKNSSEEDQYGEDLDQYVTDMLRCMRDVNVDNNTVGWYMSTYMNSWLDPEGPTVATQFQFQDSVPKSVCLVYDPIRTLSGSVHLKAYRLSDRFMAKYRDHQDKQNADKNQYGFTESDIKPKFDVMGKVTDEGITIDDIFEEVPIRIHNSALVMAMLYDWHCEGTMGAKLHSDFERLDLASRPFLEKSVENMVDGIEALRQDQERAEYRKRENQRKCKDARRNAAHELSKEELQKMYPDPSRLEGLLIANQVRSYCDSIANFTGQSLTKLYLVKGLQDDKKLPC